MAEGKQTVAGAYQKIDAHERECALRYKALESGIDDLKLGGRWIIGLLATVAIGLIGWLGVQVYELNREAVRTVRPEPASAVRAWPNVAAPVATKLGESQRFQGRNPA